MSTARLTIRPETSVSPPGRRVEVDCEHGTTTLTMCAPAGGLVLPDDAISRVAVAKHYSEERCRCTRRLRARLGMVL